MQNGGAENHLSANAGDAFGAEGMDGKGWDLKAGDDAAGTSTADASAILANSGFHLELVQGANMLSNAVDVTITGGNSHVSDVGEDHPDNHLSTKELHRHPPVQFAVKRPGLAK